MKVASYSEFKNNLKFYLDSVIDDNDILIIRQAKGRAGVLISLDEYNAITERARNFADGRGKHGRLFSTD
ncbi:MAG: type II toxin-antitoxin system Phd/YefM family antitoxin [Tannerella sp.]|jgi:prevent-host-death family protein|nr:type II toxin-antitoxin system Phd/YefM family antitoxin [Tannerella sp.]